MHLNSSAKIYKVQSIALGVDVPDQWVCVQYGDSFGIGTDHESCGACCDGPVTFQVSRLKCSRL